MITKHQLAIEFPEYAEKIHTLKIENAHYWLPYSISQYPNFREDYKTSELLNKSMVM